MRVASVGLSGHFGGMSLSPKAQQFCRFVTNRLTLTMWLLVKLPSALFCGLRCHAIDATGCTTSIPYGWRSQNPFKSTYFAAQAMAAEFSTGALVLLATENAEVPFSTLIVDMKSTFGKKAVARATFRCDGGSAVFQAVKEAKETGEARVVALETIGTMADGTEVSRFTFTWSVKPKAKR